MGYIPIDDIATEYMSLDIDRKHAVSDLVRGHSSISVVSIDSDGDAVKLYWKAGEELSIHLIIGLIMTGRSEFGRIWLEELRDKISQIK